MRSNHAFRPPLNQIALSVIDLRRTEHWFREGLGLLPAGGSRLMMRGPLASLIQGLPKAASTCWWLVGRNPWFQLELFQFERPLARPMPPDFRPCDTGYTRIGVWVADFNLTMDKLAQLGSTPLAAPLGPAGARRACVRNPDGVFVEIMEDDPLAGRTAHERHDCPVAIRSVTMSTPAFAESCAYLHHGIGLQPSLVALHGPEHEALWGLAGAQLSSAVFEAGDVLVEVVSYSDPAGKPWPQGYRICDQGILNIAFGARNKRDHMAVFDRLQAFGARPNCRPIHIPGSGVVYVNDKHGFSVEVLWMKPGRADRDWGFEPLPIAQRPQPDTHAVGGSVHIGAGLEQVWDVVSDHEGMVAWSGFNPITVIRAGHPTPNGYGSERRMQGPPGIGVVVEQVVTEQAPHLLRYRVLKGSPFICHQGEVRLRHSGAGTQLDWNIRFRPRLPGTGWLFQRVLSGMLDKLLWRHLKPYAESAPRRATPGIQVAEGGQ
jgi:catechol 2,3-dioxygenase-like lactoylglutathione lyase family enzyme